MKNDNNDNEIMKAKMKLMKSENNEIIMIIMKIIMK